MTDIQLAAIEIAADNAKTNAEITGQPSTFSSIECPEIEVRASPINE